MSPLSNTHSGLGLFRVSPPQYSVAHILPCFVSVFVPKMAFAVPAVHFHSTLFALVGPGDLRSSLLRHSLPEVGGTDLGLGFLRVMVSSGTNSASCTKIQAKIVCSELVSDQFALDPGSFGTSLDNDQNPLGELFRVSLHHWRDHRAAPHVPRVLSGPAPTLLHPDVILPRQRSVNPIDVMEHTKSYPTSTRKAA